jgi:hypothetical protein
LRAVAFVVAYECHTECRSLTKSRCSIPHGNTFGRFVLVAVRFEMPRTKIAGGEIGGST